MQVFDFRKSSRKREREDPDISESYEARKFHADKECVVCRYTLFECTRKTNKDCGNLIMDYLIPYLVRKRVGIWGFEEFTSSRPQYDMVDNLMDLPFSQRVYDAHQCFIGRIWSPFEVDVIEQLNRGHASGEVAASYFYFYSRVKYNPDHTIMRLDEEYFNSIRQDQLDMLELRCFEAHNDHK